jgi:hypothetical protein
VSVNDGRLARFKGQLEGFTGAVVVDLSDHGKQPVAVPAGSIVATVPTTAGG